MKSVLLHVQDDNGLEARLQAALSLVRATQGHLSCLHITPINAYVAFDGFGGTFVMNDIMKALEDQEQAMREKMEAQLSKEDVSWDYQQTTADPTRQLVARAALNDVVVLSRDNHHQTSAYPSMAMFGDILHASHTPVFVQPPDRDDYDPLGPVIVAWNGSFESANALRQALPLIQLASSTFIVSIEEPEEGRFPSVAASEYLSRHGITSEVVSHGGGSRSTSENIIDAAQIQKASTIVMGAYGHSRAREYLFGGVTRTMLKDCPIPLLLGR